MDNIYAYPHLIVFIFTMAMGIFILANNYKSSVNISLFLLALAAAGWQLGTFLVFISKNEVQALFWGRRTYWASIFIPIATYHFVVNFLHKRNQHKYVIIAYIIGFFVFLPSTLTPYFTPYMKKHFYGYYWVGGPMHIALLVFSLILLIFTFGNLILSYKHEASSLEKLRKKYLIIAFAIAYIGVVDYMPDYGINIYPFGYIPVMIYLSMLAYAIIKTRIIDINIAITRGVIFLFVFIVVLGIPFVLGYYILGKGLWHIPLLLGMLLAASGPSLYLFLQRKLENKLLREEKTYQHNLETLADKIAFMRNINEIASLVVNDCLSSIKLKYASLYVYDELNREYKIVKSQGGINNSVNGIISNDDDLIKALQNRREILIADELQHNSSQNNNISNNSQILETMQEINASLIAPCFTKKGLAGFIVFGEKATKRHFTEDDITTFSILANKTAIGIENDWYDKRMYDRTQQEAISDLAFGAAHQFHASLANISSTAELAAIPLKDINIETLSPEDAKNYLKTCLSRLEAIIKITLDGKNIVGSIIDKKKALEEFSSINIYKVVEQALKKSYTEKQKSILEQEDMTTPTILNEIPKDAPAITANEVLLENAFLNLFNNAYDACIEKHRFLKEGKLPEYKGALPYKAKITISLKDLEKTVIIKVQDNGLGMKEEGLRRLFVPFSTTKATSKKGHGIGLNVVREIIEKDHNGRVSAESEYAKGTFFIIELPKNKG